MHRFSPTWPFVSTVWHRRPFDFGLIQNCWPFMTWPWKTWYWSKGTMSCASCPETLGNRDSLKEEHALCDEECVPPPTSSRLGCLNGFCTAETR